MGRRRIGFTNLYIANSIDFGILFGIHVDDLHKIAFAESWFGRFLVGVGLAKPEAFQIVTRFAKPAITLVFQ